MDEWCWQYYDCDISHGPFKDKDSAIADAVKHGAEVIQVSKIWRPFVGTMASATVNLDEILQRLITIASDAGYQSEGSAFVADNLARMELKEVIQDWAQRRIASTVWGMTHDGLETLNVKNMNMKKKEEPQKRWCWMPFYDKSQSLFGWFDTYEGAVLSAKATYVSKIRIGEAQWPFDDNTKITFKTVTLVEP